MPKLEMMEESVRKMLLAFPCIEPEDTPWTTLQKPLAEARVALVTTAGLHVRGDKPFVQDRGMPRSGGDTSYRVIPRDTEPKNILQSHTSIAFDHTGIYRDINVTFPVDRLQEMLDRGEIGSLSNNYYSFMGAIRDVDGIIEESGPAVASKLKEDNVDVVLLPPT